MTMNILMMTMVKMITYRLQNYSYFMFNDIYITRAMAMTNYHRTLFENTITYYYNRLLMIMINDLSISPRSQRQVLLLCITWSMDWRDDGDDGLITASQMARAVPWQLWPPMVENHRVSGGSIGNMRKNVEQNVENHRFTRKYVETMEKLSINGIECWDFARENAGFEYVLLSVKCQLGFCQSIKHVGLTKEPLFLPNRHVGWVKKIKWFWQWPKQIWSLHMRYGDDQSRMRDILHQLKTVVNIPWWIRV